MGSNYILRQACATVLAMSALAASGRDSRAAEPPASAQNVLFDIKPQSLAPALSEFALQTHQQILFTPEIVQAKATQGVKGAMAPEAALDKLLAGTSLVFSRSSDGMILVSNADAKEASAKPGPFAASSGEPGGRSQSVPSQAPQSTTLEELVVTATGRRQNIQDVPYNLSAVSGDVLQAAGITDFYGLAKAVPGLAVADVGPRGGLSSSLVIRGISVDAGTSPQFPAATQPVVSTYIDSTPIFANLRITDLDRVEVLRGPQGTLYGANSSGGTIRFIYNQPQFDELAAKISGGLGSTDGAPGLNYRSDLTLNIPLADRLALRVNVGQERNAGFIDADNRYVLGAASVPVASNPSDPVNSPALRTQANDVNSDRTTSARGVLRWQPGEAFDAKLSFQYQTQDSGAPQLVSYQAYGIDSRETSAQIAEPFHSTVDLAALEIESHLGFATFTSSTSHFETKAQATNDFTGFYYSFPFYTDIYGNSPRFLAEGIDAYDSSGFVQELRLASESSGAFKWIAGAFYQRRRTVTVNQQYVPGYSDYYAACSADSTNTRPCGLGSFYPQIASYDNGAVQNAKDFAYLNNSDVLFTDEALYGELEWRLSSQWRLTAGLRGYRQSTTDDEIGGLLFLGPGGVGGATLTQSGNGVLTKVGLSYDLTPSTMIYALFSQGIRPAGINGLPTSVFSFSGAPTPTPAALFEYKSDKIDNFEMGIKGTILPRLAYTVTYFDMRWNDVQVGTSVTALQIGAVINAGNANSRGVEFELSGPITQRLSASIGYTYVDAKLTTVDPPNGVDASTSFSVGAKLPGVPDQLASVDLHYAQPFDTRTTLTYAVGGYYRGRSSSELLTSQDTPAGGFLTTDASTSLTRDNWTVQLSVRNIANRTAVYGYTPANWGNWSGAAVTRPRTIGLSASYDFR
jgi:outer membrane receptor protein involved in Fe transport